jgi:hypothetical protein
MRGWQQGRNSVTIVYESFFLIAMVFESLTLDNKEIIFEVLFSSFPFFL